MIKLPHVPRRRDGDQRLVREVDDIMLLLSRLDSASEMTYIVSSGALNSTHSLISAR